MVIRAHLKTLHFNERGGLRDVNIVNTGDNYGL